MARPIKTGIDYYPLDVDFLQDIKVRKIMRACGVQSIAILISLLSSIYKDEGYYVVWDSDMTFLVADEVGASEGAVLEVVNKATQVDFFDKDIFEKYKVLTSKGIQKRFIEITTRRKRVNLVSEYLLIDLVNEYKNLVNVYINSINDNRSTQRKEKESKEKNSNKNNVQNDCTTSVSKGDINNFFESVWKLYPVKKGKGRVSDAKKKMLYELGYDTMAKCIERYKSELEKDKDWRKPQNGSTFFNSGYIDYLDENYVPCEKIKKVNSNSFNDFEQRDYTKQNMDDLEKKLLRGQK